MALKLLMQKAAPATPFLHHWFRPTCGRAVRLRRAVVKFQARQIAVQGDGLFQCPLGTAEAVLVILELIRVRLKQFESAFR